MVVVYMTHRKPPEYIKNKIKDSKKAEDAQKQEMPRKQGISQKQANFWICCQCSILLLNERFVYYVAGPVPGPAQTADPAYGAESRLGFVEKR